MTALVRRSIIDIIDYVTYNIIWRYGTGTAGPLVRASRVGYTRARRGLAL